jgi:hypothetical protein
MPIVLAERGNDLVLIAPPGPTGSGAGRRAHSQRLPAARSSFCRRTSRDELDLARVELFSPRNAGITPCHVNNAGPRRARSSWSKSDVEQDDRDDTRSTSPR